MGIKGNMDAGYRSLVGGIPASIGGNGTIAPALVETSAGLPIVNTNPFNALTALSAGVFEHSRAENALLWQSASSTVPAPLPTSEESDTDINTATTIVNGMLAVVGEFNRLVAEKKRISQPLAAIPAQLEPDETPVVSQSEPKQYQTKLVTSLMAEIGQKLAQKQMLKVAIANGRKMRDSDGNLLYRLPKSLKLPGIQNRPDSYSRGHGGTVGTLPQIAFLIWLSGMQDKPGMPKNFNIMGLYAAKHKGHKSHDKRAIDISTSDLTAAQRTALAEALANSPGVEKVLYGNQIKPPTVSNARWVKHSGHNTHFHVVLKKDWSQGAITAAKEHLDKDGNCTNLAALWQDVGAAFSAST